MQNKITEKRTAIITGAASGIGLETVRRFSADPKYKPIYAVDKDPVIHTIFDAQNYPHVVPMQVDVRRGNENAEMFKRVRIEAKRLDVIVNAAGTIIAGNENNSAASAQIRDLNDTNFAGQMYIMVMAETMMESWGGGTIINITSSKDYFPDPYRLEYMASKMRFEDMSLEARNRLKGSGVRVVIVKPGNTKTNIDRGAWTDGSNDTEMKAVQGFNDWWRKTFGNDPKNVAEVIYKIAEGKIDKEKVHVGFDAKLGNFLIRAVPGWRYIFFFGSMGAYELVKKAQKLKNKGS